MNGPPHSALVFPEPLDEDDDDIRWALHTAAVQWRRGAREDAVAWVRRGADAAVDGGFWERASQLNVAAASLERLLSGGFASEAPTASKPPGASSIPKPPPRLPTPVAQSALPQASRGSVTSQAPPPSAKPAQLSRPPAVRVPALTSSASDSRWPTGFPKGTPPTSTPSGHAIAPPPPLPANLKKAPIPPPPKAKTRDAVREDVEIEISDESVDLTDEDLTLGEDASFGSPGDFTKPSAGALPSDKTQRAGLNALPSYDLDEDPSDGTTSLPDDPLYASSYPPATFEERGLPAFPLEESMPPALPSAPPRSAGSLRQNPPPRFGSSKPPESASPGRRSSAAPSRPASAQNRWASREQATEPPRRPSPSRAAPGQTSPSPSRFDTSVRPYSMSEEPTVKGYRLSADLGDSDDTGDALLQPLSADARATEPPGSSGAERVPAMRAPTPTSDDLLEPLEEDGSAPPSTARGLGQLGSGPPEPLASDAPPLRSRPVSRPGSTRPPPRGISVPSAAPAGSQATRKSQPASTQPVAAAVPLEEQRDRSSDRPSASRHDIQSELPRVPPLSELPLPNTSAEHVVEEVPASVPPSLRGIAFSDVRGLCDLPDEAQRLLRKRARIERMGTGEDLSFFAVVLVLEGWVKLMPAIADVTCATASAGDVVFTQGTLDDGVALRVVAGQNGTTLATWDRATFGEITETCPWVGDELRLIADSFQALAGTTLGPLGERLDDALREVVTSRCRVLTLLPHEVLVERGKPVPGMHIVGGGAIELLDDSGNLVGSCTPGEFLLTAQVLAGGVAPYTARAASGGALVLFAPRMDAHELLVSVPPLLEILAG